MAFAFSDRQFAEGMRALGLDLSGTGQVLSIGGGGFIRKTDAEAFHAMFRRHRLERRVAMDTDRTGDGYLLEMFRCKLSDHEYGYTRDAEPALMALGISWEDIGSDERMRYVIETACLQEADWYGHVLKKGRSAGRLNSWPLCGKCCIQRDCKLPPITAYMRSLGSGVIQYIGIAHDEQKRLMRLEAGKTISLLAKYKKTERDAADICRRAGLYSPAYAFTDRNGCFFCPNAKDRELRHLYDCHPDLWARLLDCQRAPNKATELFNRDERFDEIDQRFRFEDAQFSLFDNRPRRAAA